MLLATVLNNIITAIVVNRIFPAYVPEGELQDSERKKIFGNVKALIGHKIGGTVVTSADNLVISAYLGLTLVAYYNNYHYLSSAVVSLISVISNSILGGLGNRLVIKSKKDNLKLFYNLTFGICWVVGWCSICLMCLSQPFMTIWMEKERLLSNHTVFWIALYFYSWQFRIIGLSFKDAAGMWQADFWKPYLGAVINIVVNIVLVNLIGLNGVLIATIIDLAGVYFPWETHVLFRDLFCCSSNDYYKKHLLYFLTIFALGVLTYLICSYVNIQGAVGLIIKALICFALPNIIMCLLFYKTDEFKFYKNICVRILKRIKAS